MFVARKPNNSLPPFGGAALSWDLSFKIHYAPPNGEYWVMSIYKHLTPNGVRRDILLPPTLRPALSIQMTY